MNDTQILKQIEKWITEDINKIVMSYATKEIKPSNKEEVINDQINYGRVKCSEELLEQIKKWKGVSDEQKT